jgi:hypothetical protein
MNNTSKDIMKKLSNYIHKPLVKKKKKEKKKLKKLVDFAKIIES